MFEPWTGKDRGNGAYGSNGVRLLVLGESHHDADASRVGERAPDMTKGVVEKLALNGSHKFFTNITQLVAGRSKRQMTREEVRAVWGSLILYNYVPVVAADGLSKAPTDEVFALGREPFLRVLETQDPDAILVCGHRLWRHMLLGLPERLWVGATGQPFRRIGRAVAARMKHPGWAFNAPEQREVVFQELLRRARPQATGRSAEAR